VGASVVTRVRDDALRSTNAAILCWRPVSFFIVEAAAGLDAISRRDEILLRRGDCLAISCGQDTVGRFSTGRGNSMVYSINVTSSFQFPLTAALTARTSLGTQFQRTTTSDLSSSAVDIPYGDGTIGGGAEKTSWDNNQDAATAGWFLEQSLAFRERLFLSAAIRRDVGSALGAQVAPIYPKWSVSWVASEEPWFARLRNVVSTLRLRSAFGHSGVQPAATDKLRTYAQSQQWVLGGVQSVLDLTTFGNGDLRPERSIELEGGFEMGVLDDRAFADVTFFRKRTRDAIINRTVAPSVNGGGARLENVGELENTGLEATLTLRLLQTAPFSWDVNTGWTRVRSRVAALGPDVEPFVVSTFPTTMIKPGYAPFGYWQRPIRGFADLDHNNVLDANEISLGDSMVYMGAGSPDYEMSLRSNMGFWNNQLQVSASFSYQSGLTQFNQPLLQRAYNSPTFNVEGTPLAEQAAYAALGAGTFAGFFQTISVFRFNDLTFSYRLPFRVVHALRAQTATISLMGSNLAMHSDYDGRDPNVNSYSVGNLTLDGGVLPQPRRWTLRFNLGY
jgi:outer membrane receptor protein involved in Fe transport